MKIYLARPISGCTADEVFTYYDNLSKQLRTAGFTVFHPMYGKDQLRTDVRFKAADYRHPASTNHAIIERDRWMVTQADVVYANLMHATCVSIGTVMELAWAHQLGRHTVLAMNTSNIHAHAFVNEAADVIWPTHEEAVDYLYTLVPPAISTGCCGHGNDH
jgi:nucleoside 2-deoxyribosyltransferase